MKDDIEDDDNRAVNELYEKLQKFIIETGQDERYQNPYVIMGATYALLSSLIRHATEGVSRNVAIKRTITCLEELEDDSSQEELQHLLKRRIKSLQKICEKHPESDSLVAIHMVQKIKPDTIH